MKFLSKIITTTVLAFSLMFTTAHAGKYFTDYAQDTTPATTDLLLKSAGGAGTTYMTFEHLFDLEDVIGKKSFEDEDWGDMSVSSNSVTLDADVVAPAEMADADHGFFTYSSGVASLDTGGLTSANLLGALTNETGTGAAVFGTSPTFTNIAASGLIDISPSGAHTSDVIDFSSVTINHTGSNGPTLLRAGTYASPISNSDEDQSGLIRMYTTTDAGGTSYDRGAFFCNKTTNTKGVFPVAGLAEVSAIASGNGPNKVQAGQFISHLNSATAKLATMDGDATAGMYGTWNKVTSNVGSVAASGSRVAAVWADNQMNGTVSGEEYGIFASTGGSVPDAFIGFETTSSGWAQFLYFDDTAYDQNPVSTNSLKVLLNATQYYIPMSTSANSSAEVELLSGATGTTGTTTSNIVFSASPTFTGTVVLPNSQALVTPVLGTPTSGTLTNCTGLPVETGLSGLDAGDTYSNFSTSADDDTIDELMAALDTALGLTEEETHASEHEPNGADPVDTWYWGGALTVGDATPPVKSGYVYDCTGATTITITDFYGISVDNHSEFTAGKTRFRVWMNADEVTIDFSSNSNIEGNADTNFVGHDSQWVMLEFLYVGSGFQCTNLFSGMTNALTVSAKIGMNTVTDADGFTMTAAQGYNYTIYATGAGTIVLPPVAQYMQFCVETHAAAAVVLNPDASGTEDTIRLDGVALSIGDSITNLSTAGDIACLTYYAADTWSAVTNGWTDTN